MPREKWKFAKCLRAIMKFQQRKLILWAVFEVHQNRSYTKSNSYYLNSENPIVESDFGQFMEQLDFFGGESCNNTYVLGHESSS